MEHYSIVETRPVNLAILLTLFILVLCFAGATGVYYTKANLLEIELVNERQRLTKMSERSDYMEAKTEILQRNYVDLILTGYMRVGPQDMRDLVQNVKGLRTAKENYPTHPKLGIGGEDEPMKLALPKPHPKKVKKLTGKSRKSRLQ